MWLASGGPVDPTLNKGGLPGTEVLSGLVGGIEYVCLLAAAAAIMFGAAAWALFGHSGNIHGAYVGRKVVLCGFGAGLFVGAAAPIVNWAFGLGQTF